MIYKGLNIDCKKLIVNLDSFKNRLISFEMYPGKEVKDILDTIINTSLKKKNKVKVTEVGQACRKCGVPVVKKVPKKTNKIKAYRYNYYLKCEGCEAMYMLESEKVHTQP